MCARFTSTKDLADLMRFIGVVIRVGFGPRFNIAPTQSAPVVFTAKKEPEMRLMRWGLIPSFTRDEHTGNPLINARLETLKTRAAFKQSFQKRRCLVPADGFYEWKEREGKKQPFRIMLKSGQPFCFAGLWERWTRPASIGEPDSDLEEAAPSQIVESFTIITTEAGPTIAPLHNRMPVILQPEHYGWWLENKPGSELFETALNNPSKEALKIYPVSDLVNSVKIEDPRCIQPVQIDRDMFEKPWWGD
jgi:putative SOS response-associated peptidase YedK